MIQVILWDIDGTLLNFKAAENAAVKSCFSIFHLGTCTDEMIEEYSCINVKYWEMLERGEKTKPQILVGRFEEFFRRRGLDPAVAPAFNDEYQIRLGDTICFFDGALETLRALKGRVLQCAVTNGTKIAQDRKLSRSGMDQIFDRIFISETLHTEKPAAAFFDRVFEVIGDYPKNEVMIVGDSLTSDMRGGNNAGVMTCWFNPERLTYDGPLRIDHEITQIPQVMDLIG